MRLRRVGIGLAGLVFVVGVCATVRPQQARWPIAPASAAVVVELADAGGLYPAAEASSAEGDIQHAQVRGLDLGGEIGKLFGENRPCRLSGSVSLCRAVK